MSKLIGLAAAVIFALTSTMSTAQAGMRGVGIGIGIGVGLGALGAMSNGRGRGEAREYRERKRERTSRREREERAPVRSAKKSKSDNSENTEQAAKESNEKSPTATNEASGIATTGGPVADPVSTGTTFTADAKPENSSISIAEGGSDSPPVKKVDTASQETTQKNLDCKKFFPSVGMTLSVPCDQN